MNFTPGSLVNVRGRDWVVLPSEEKDLMLLKPLGGADEEITGIYLPLNMESDKPVTKVFDPPTVRDIGNLADSRLLFDAARLAFRNGAGPFRSLAKLSFRPRSYQMVPLVMALRQKIVRLLIADDVGVGKTIEALLIMRELLERRVIRRFAVICLPHLCEQWQEEIESKLDIEAVIIRSSTQARLDREIQGDISVFEHYPYQVISIDFIKSESRVKTFIHQCPELVIVDEAHSCARPQGASKTQQQRYSLLTDIASRENQHLVLLTATPHSGKPEEFQSILGLVRSDFEQLDLSTASDPERRDIAKHFIQRRRADVAQWCSETTQFADRDSKEVMYEMSPEADGLFDEILDFARSLVKEDAEGHRRRVSYWTALALLRGVVSSPAAGASMLRARLDRTNADEFITEDDSDNPVHDADPGFTSGFESDMSPVEVMEHNEWTDSQKRRLSELAFKMDSLATPAKDSKLAATELKLAENLKDGFNTVVFCRYIATAKYVGEMLATILKKQFPKLDLQVITSEDPDDLRRQRVEAMKEARQRVLVATDCLSEGINLQDIFNAVVHYDLPWNPNRLEQREGRVDRFGQISPVVRATQIYGKNPVDGIVLDVILRKIREIRKSTGINIPFPEDSRSIIDSIAQAVLLSPGRKLSQKSANQLEFEFEELDVAREVKIRVSEKIKEAEKREKISRSIFAQHSIKADEMEKDLKEVDESLGDPAAVREFAVHALSVMGVQITEHRKGWRIVTANLHETLRSLLPNKPEVLISFESPTPEGLVYLGRNNPFIEQLCHIIMRNTMDCEKHKAARTSVIRSNVVVEKHTIFLCRCRNVIERGGGDCRFVAEEMILWGYRGTPSSGKFISHSEAKKIIGDIQATANLTVEACASFINNELSLVPSMKTQFDKVAEDRSNHLAEAHQRFSKLLAEKERFQVVHPVLPMDLLGIYIILPEVKQ